MSNLTGQSIGRYHILEQLGEGGMATVYKAYDTDRERNVAFKVLRTETFSPLLLEQVLKRFEREAKSLAKLSHPNIVKILDYGDHEGSPYLVMEYLPGGTLKQKLGQAIPWKQAIQILLPIAHGLAYAHHESIIHRDIKPANILMDNLNAPILTDFGIAKLLEGADSHTLTASGVGIGTPEYMAPEQGIGASTIDARADIYSLGIVLYEMVTGRKPYIADTPMAVVLKQMTDPLPRPTDFVPDLPEDVEHILFKALAKQPEDRYEDMDTFITAMVSVLTDAQTIEASVPTKRVKKKSTTHVKPSRRSIMIVVGALTAILVVALGLQWVNQQFSNAPEATSTTALTIPITSTHIFIAQSATPAASPSPTQTITSRSTATNTPIPAWVTNFAEPLLAAIKDQKPDFQDDFSANEPNGWHIPWGDGAISIEEGVLRLKRNVGAESVATSNIYTFKQWNFIYQVEISRPSSSRTHVRINNRYSIYLQSNGWGICQDWSDCGSSHSFSFNQIIQVTVLVKDTQAVFYLSGIPVFHIEDPGLMNGGWATPMIECSASCEIDNVKFWNIDKVQIP